MEFGKDYPQLEIIKKAKYIKKITDSCANGLETWKHDYNSDLIFFLMAKSNRTLECSDV